MGAFFTNYQVRADSIEAVRGALAGLVQRRAYISPPKNGWVTVYDEASDDQDDKILRRLAEGISKKLNTVALALLVHDSDIAAYWLYRQGRKEDEFNSKPDYFEKVDAATRARTRGNPDALLPLCIAGTTRAQVDLILHDPEGPPIFAENIFTDLAPLLGIDPARITFGFTYFESEGPGALPDVAEFEPVGKGAERMVAETELNAGTAAPIPDLYPVAISMLIQSWNPEKILGPQMMAMMSARGAGDAMMKKFRTGLDKQAREMLKHCKLEGRPDFDTLKAARDEGPEALARLLAQRAPAQLADFGICGVTAESEAFVAALLTCGLDPNAAGHNGATPLSVSERRSPNSLICAMLKKAATGGG